MSVTEPERASGPGVAHEVMKQETSESRSRRGDCVEYVIKSSQVQDHGIEESCGETHEGAMMSEYSKK